MKKPIEELLNFGIINIDKCSGPTSFNVSHFVKKKLGLKKTAHFGTLDPKVTGVLPVSLGRACKIMGYFLGADKEYVGIMRMYEEVSLEDVKKIIEKKFSGVIKQTPPVKSRVKRQEREREIKSFDLIEQNGKDILFKTEVQGGTYIRKLCDDLGNELGVGAHMLELRRIRAGIFKEPSVNLYDFEKAVDEYTSGDDSLLRKIIIPAEEALKQIYPTVKINGENLKQILNGVPIKQENVVGKKILGGKIIVTYKKKFIGMYSVINGEEIYSKSEFIF